MRFYKLALVSTALVGGLLLPTLADDREERKKRREERRAAARAEAEQTQRQEQAAQALRDMASEEPMRRFVAGWDLMALPSEMEAVVLGALSPAGAPELVSSAVDTAGEAGLLSAFPSLSRLAKDRDQPMEVRLSALLSAAKLLTPDSRALLAATAQDAAAELPLREAALVALGMQEAPEAGALLEELLTAPEPTTRRAAFRVVGYLKDRRYVEHCLDGLNDRYPAVQAMAGNALGKIGDPATADALKKVVNRVEHPALQWVLIEALSRLGVVEATEHFYKVLADRRSPSQADAATVLYEIGERRAIPRFREIVSEVLTRQRRVEGAAVIAAFALGVFEDAESAPVLRKALKSGNVSLRREAARALGALGDVGAVKLLEAAVREADTPLRGEALMALARIGNVEAGRALRTACADPEPSVRYFAALALQQASPRELKTALPLLNQLLQDVHPSVQQAARGAIAKLSDLPQEVAPEARSELFLRRLRALEREYLLRLRMATAQGEGWVAPLIVVWTEATPIWETVGYESWTTTCGGTHPPITFEREIKEFRGMDIGETRVDRRTPSQEEIARNELGRQRAEDMEATFRLKEMRAEAEALRRDDAARTDEERTAAAEQDADAEVPSGAAPTPPAERRRD